MFNKIKIWVNTHKYSYAMLYMIIYLVTFFTLEAVMKPRYIVHCRLDDLIPFCEYMAIPYFSWLILFPGSLFFYMFYDKEDFLNLCMLMFGGSVVCFAAYIIWPTGLNLRADINEGTILGKLISILWAVDTPTNVCPSLHVSTSTAIAAVTARSSLMKKKPVVSVLVIVWMLIICVSTVFVKQHSVIDVLLGVLVSVVFYYITYHTDWRGLISKTFLKIILED